MKKLSALVLVMTYLFALIGCEKQAALDLANANCDTVFKLTMPESALQGVEGLTKGGGWGCYDLADEDVRYTLAGYPDVLDAYHVTQIDLLSNRYHIFGITLGDPFSQARKQLEAFGFREDVELSALYGAVMMVMDNVIIRIAAQDDIIYSLDIRVAVTNKDHVDF